VAPSRRMGRCANTAFKVMGQSLNGEENMVSLMMEIPLRPYANAVAERVNATMKHEFLLEELPCDLRIRQRVVAQSVAIYNGMRPHLSCGMLSPDQMHSQNEKKVKTYRIIRHSTGVRAMS